MGFTSSRIRESAQSRTSGTMEQMLADRRVSIGDSGVSVTRKTVAGLPAFDAGISLAANAVAQLTAKVWRGDGPIRSAVTTTWQSRLFRGQPNPGQDWFRFWYTIEASRTARRNAYIWKTKDANGQVIAMTALHPDQVWPFRTLKGRIQFSITFSQFNPIPPEIQAYGSYVVDSSVIRHIRGKGGVGELIAPSPLDEFRSSLGLAVAKQEHEASVYRNGAQGGLVVSFPAGVSKAQADVWREGFDSDHAGVANSGRTKVTGNGATVAQIGMSQRDTQFIESVGMSLMDIALILDIPPWLLGVSEKTTKPASPEHEMQRWMYFHLAPRLAAIEAAINADPDLFGLTDYMAFDTANVIRGDLTTEAEIAIRKVQAGIWIPDEARSRDSLGPLADGVGKIAQVTPVGGTPNAPAPKAPAE